MHFGGKTIVIDCPTRLKKYVSYTGNYLYINEKANAEIGNAPIWEKISHYKNYINEKGTLGCKLADIQFKMIEEFFEDLPNKAMINSDEEAQKAFDLYYSDFEKRYKKYMERIKEMKMK